MSEVDFLEKSETLKLNQVFLLLRIKKKKLKERSLAIIEYA